MEDAVRESRVGSLGFDILAAGWDSDKNSSHLLPTLRSPIKRVQDAVLQTLPTLDKKKIKYEEWDKEMVSVPRSE